MATKPNASGLRLLQIIKLLKGRSLTGLSNTDLAKALAASPATITRDLVTLQQEGFVTKLDNDRYALSIALLGIAEAHRLEVQKSREKIDELDQRVIAAAH